ncbi:helix-turn-helix transcriptional regulator [Agreia pratensis]|uniref:helix-turn-helix transcriptional regulator n=1 Tax=Agreia pratensis TaxID=150121 RepID=UPI00188A8C66|nr:helix-turn-helix transcriptional regulator [Agreia pratensis]MBF4636299.1 helix-turn-helix transcriptional regulator [Agreia pratensis]
MNVSDALGSALDGDDWQAVNRLIDDHFFRLLFTQPDLLLQAFDTAPPQWYADHPRNLMSSTIAELVRKSTSTLDLTRVQAFRDWVESQPSPAMRDVLGIQMVKLRDLVAHGWFADASALADGVLNMIRTAPEREEGLRDVQPQVLLSCGVAKLLNGEVDAAAPFFSEAIRWSTIGDEHPFAVYAREHLALVHALEERYAEASALLGEQPAMLSPSNTLQHVYEPAGLLARLLVAAASLDSAGLGRGLDELDSSVYDGDLGWIALHARSLLALIDGNPLSAIHRIHTVLSTTAHRTPPATLAGSVLRADLAALYQAAGDLRAAEKMLSSPSRGPHSSRPGVVIPTARQALLRGRPNLALSLLQQDERSDTVMTPGRYTPSGAVLYASAELAVTGTLGASALELAVTTVNHHRAHGALMNASPELRQLLFGQIDYAFEVPQPWVYRARIKLTPREQEILRALQTHPTINMVAASLHVSPNTAKTHIRALYRKLGAHTRDEAIWLGNE